MTVVPLAVAADLLQRFQRVRQRTVSLSAPLSAEDLMVQSMPDASPGKWHLAHTTWFFEQFVLSRRPGHAPRRPEWMVLFNSYYQSVGPMHARPRRAPLAIVFSEPQIAIAGASHAELLATGREFDIGRVSFADQGRSRVMLVNRGGLHVYAERGTGRLLGAEMIGPAAEHLGHLLAWSVQRGDTVRQMLDCPFYHPVVEEGLRTALRQLHSDLHLPPPPIEDCMDCDTEAEVGG